jgi:hypothetical protein
MLVLRGQCLRNLIQIKTNDISEKQLAQIALEIQNRWDVPTFVKMHEIVVAEDDLDPAQSHELFKDFENGLSIIFENLRITAAFRLRRTGKLKYEIERMPGSQIPGWMVEIEKTPKVPEGVYECPHCGRRFPTDIQLSLHTKLHYIT